MRRVGLLSAVLVVTTSAVARADTPERRDDVLSVPLVGLTVHSLGLEYEHRVAPRWSVMTAMAYRTSGGEDYDVWEAGFGTAGRFWLMGAGRPALRGPFLGARLDYGLTHASLHGRSIGSTLRHGESVSFGWRFLPWKSVEITPSVGLGVRTEWDARGRLAPWTRAELFRFGTTAGWVF